MFTDMVGYSALSQRDESLSLQLLEEHREIVRPLLARHGGREIKTIGDAFLVEFASAFAAATCAIEIQQALHERNLTATADHRIRLRIGLHAGDIIHSGNDVYGDGVNIAARIEPLAEPEGICVSEDVARQIQNKVPYPLVRLGTGELKNISLPVELHQIRLPWTRHRQGPSVRLAFFLRRKSVRRVLVAGLVVLGVLAAVLYRGGARSPAPPPGNRLAVLPLVNFSGEPRDEYFADGMTEELISALATIRELDVIARTSVARFKDARAELPEIGRMLQVAAVLEGSVRIVGDQARIDIRLVDTMTQRTLWNQTYARMIKDVFAVQSAIAENVAEALKVRLLSGEKNLIERRGTGNGDAYRQYLLGQTQLGRRTGDAVMAAIGYFSRSIEMDPGFALAHAGLAEAYTLAGSAGYGSLPRARCNELAREYGAKAVALDDSLAEAHVALAYVRFRVDWDWAAADTEFRRALALKPGHARAHEWYALYLAVQRRFPEALAEMRRALQLDPLSPSVSNGLGRILHFDHQFEAALAQFQQTLALDSRYAEAYFSQGLSLHALKRHDEAIASVRTALELSGHRPIMRAMLGMIEGLAGNVDQAAEIYADMVAKAQAGSGVSPYYLGLISFGLGDRDRAFLHFEQALAEREGIMIYLAIEPTTEPLATDPRYRALLERMNLSGSAARDASRNLRP